MPYIKHPTVEAAHRALYPELHVAPGVKMDNQLGQASDTLWRTVAKEYIDTTAIQLAPLTHLTRDMTKDATDCLEPGVQPVCYVELIDGAGEALDETTTNWEQSDLSNHYISVRLKRRSRPFALSINDLMHGEKIANKIGAAMQVVANKIMADYTACLAAALPTPTGADVAPVAHTRDSDGQVTSLGTIGIKHLASAAALTPEFVAHELSPMFGDRGLADELVLTPHSYAKLIPTNRDDLDPRQGGVYGINHIESTALLAPADGANSALGVLLRPNGVVMAGGLPNMEPITRAGGIAVRDLGTVAGIPMLLKAWVNPGQERIYHSVEAFVGFAIGDPTDAYVISPRTAPEGA